MGPLSTILLEKGRVKTQSNVDLGALRTGGSVVKDHARAERIDSQPSIDT